MAKINAAYVENMDRLDKSEEIDPLDKSFFQLIPDNIDRLQCVFNRVRDFKKIG